MSVVCEERAELVYKQIRRRMQFISTAASVASTEEMKRLNQCLEDLMKYMGYSEFGSSLRSIENFPANRYIIKQRQKKNSRPLNKQKLSNVMKPDEDVDTTLLFPNSVTQGVYRNTYDGHRFCALARLISHTHSENS
ncbi:hypothetical protein TNCV_2242291 [Trichonephila clavipes]|nr:hypothetical protein TNCV_2242291 [Trichonephila clavipes]